MKSVLEAVDFMDKHLDRGNIVAAVRCVMIQLYIPSDMAGYRTLVAAIPAFYGDCDQSVTKELYVDVGYQLKISKWKVEKDIRDVIRKAWKRRDREVWWAYFPQEKPPTNSEFMARVAEVVKLWQECAEKESV